MTVIIQSKVVVGVSIKIDPRVIAMKYTVNSIPLCQILCNQQMIKISIKQCKVMRHMVDPRMGQQIEAEGRIALVMEGQGLAG